MRITKCYFVWLYFARVMLSLNYVTKLLHFMYQFDGQYLCKVGQSDICILAKNKYVSI